MFGNETSVQTFADSGFSNKLLQGLSSLRQNEKFFDMMICVGDMQFPCHRVVLAASSNYFRSMFAGMMKESSSETVTIFDVEPLTMESLINFCYSGSVTITEDNVTDLLKAADLFQFPTVRDACCDFLAKRLHPSNCINIRDFAENMSCTKLVDLALTFIAKNIVAVSDYHDFLALPYNVMRQLVSSADLHVYKEENVYEIMLLWLRHNVQARSDSFCRLMECVRLPFIRRIYLLANIETNPIVRRSALCQELIRETRKFHTCMLDRQDSASIRLQPRPATGIAELLIIVGGCDDNCDEAAAIDSYNPVAKSWRALARFEDCLRGGYATTALGNDIYVTGGSHGNTVYNKAWRYNSQVNEWTEISPMLNPREYHGSLVLNSFIYVVGAEGCECYDFMSDKWSEIAPLPHPVSNCSVTSCCGKIYSIGNLFNSEEMIVQVYAPDTGSWSVLPCALPQMAFVPHITSLKRLLYFIREDSTQVLCYDPLSLKWLDTPPMQHLHLGGSVTVFGGRLVVSGGYDETFRLSGLIEAFDPDSATWSVIGKMQRPTFWHGCVSIYRFVSTPAGREFSADRDIHNLAPLLAETT